MPTRVTLTEASRGIWAIYPVGVNERAIGLGTPSLSLTVAVLSRSKLCVLSSRLKSGDPRRRAPVPEGMAHARRIESDRSGE